MTPGPIAHRDSAHAQEIAVVVDALSTDPERGLSQGEAARRLVAVGPNVIDEAPETSAWARMGAQFRSPLVALLGAAIAISIAAWALEGRTGVPLDAAVVAAIVMANAAIGFVQEGKAANAVAELRRLVPANALVIRSGEAHPVPAADIVPGDLIVLTAGDTVPADARVVSSAGLSVAEAVLTGESEPAPKDTPPVTASAPVGDRSSMVFGTTSVVSGRGQALVTATGMATEVGDIAELLHETIDPPTPLERELAALGRLLGSAVVLIAVVVMAVSVAASGVHSTHDAVELLLIGVSLAVAAVPEGLPAVLSLVLAIGVRRMAGRNALLKRLAFAETLGATTVICTDKTGTLTRNEMTVRRLVTAVGDYEFAGVGYRPQGAITRVSAPGTVEVPESPDFVCALNAAVIASDGAISQDGATWAAVGDPTEAALVSAAVKAGLETNATRARFVRVAELPFDSARKRMSTLCHDDGGSGDLVLFMKGAPEVVLPLCIVEQAGSWRRALEPCDRERWHTRVGTLADDGLRTLAVACKVLPAGGASLSGRPLTESDERDLVLLGVFGIMDPPRPEVRAAVLDAQSAGIRVVMITGDHPITAGRIAAEVGIDGATDVAVTGSQIDDLDEHSLAEVIDGASVYSRVAPRHKLHLVEALRARGHVVAMTGDGVNDAPALKAADIGIAMGVTGSDVSKGAADMILTDDNFATIVAAVEEGRSIFTNIASFLRYLLSSNMGEVLTMFLGVVFATVIGLEAGAEGVVAPLAATQILWINLLTDTGPALALGVDPVDHAVMRERPRRRSDRLIDPHMVRTIVLLGLTMAVAALAMLDAKLPGGLIEGSDDLDTARTAAFTVLVLAQLFNAFNTRSDRCSAFGNLTSNRWLLGSVAFSLVLQVAVVHLAALNTAFSTAPLSLADWMWCGLLASSVLWVGETQKLFTRRRT